MTDADAKLEEAKSFVSGLGVGREAFHSEVTEYCLRIGERTPEDFIRHFSPMLIMQKLATRPMERARIVGEATGVNDRVAQKMSPENSGEALQIALEEKVTTPADIVRLFQPDDRQRYLERKSLWKFDTEGEPWKVTATNRASHERAKSYLAYIIERAIANLLLSHEELVQALTVGKLAEHLPREALGLVISASLKRDDKFTEVQLLEVVPAKTLVKHVPLDYVWDKAIAPLIAERHEYAEKSSGESSVSKAEGSKANASKGEGSKGQAGKTEASKPSNAKPAEESAEGSWSLPPDGPKPARDEDDGDLVGEDEIMEDAAPSADAPAAASGSGKRSLSDVLSRKR
jgi:hypothetical protein